MTGIAGVIAAVAGWSFGQRDRVTGAVLTGVAVIFWFFAFGFLIENCGAGGGCEEFANWPESKALRFVLAPSLASGVVATFISRMVKRRRRGSVPPQA